MDHSSLIDDLGGTNRVARLARVKPPSVTGWRKGGIPEDKLVILAGEVERVRGIPRWVLLPNVWHQIWPELINTPGAPPVPTLENAAREAVNG